MNFYKHDCQGGATQTLLTSSLLLLTSLTRVKATNYALPPPDIPGIPQQPSNNNYPNAEYARLVSYSLYFYEAQRSGKLPNNNRVSWRHDSALNDGQDVGLDLSGGYYDAALEWGNGYQLSNQTQYLNDMIRWGTDWLIKASSNTTNSTGNLYVMVGNLNKDHNYWGPDTNIPTPRPSTNVNSTAHGTDVSGAAAAALAASSLLYLNQFNDSVYADKLLTYAKNLYSFAETTPFTKYSISAPQVADAYSSSDYADELVWGALWLYRATNDNSYLNKAVDYYNTNSIVKKLVFNWDEKSGGCYVLFAQLFQQSGQDSSKWKSLAEKYLDSFLNQSDACSLTNGGLLWCYGDSNQDSLNPAINIAFLCLIYAPIATSSAKSQAYINFAMSQIDYVLGKNPINVPYVIGVHPNSPQNPHHAGASGGIDVNNLNNPPQTQHILYGGIVGGPDQNDQYSDSRRDYIQSEVALDYNAAFQGLMAYQTINSHSDPYYVNVPPGRPKPKISSLEVVCNM
ncbi:5349_t:CDS:2 [Scutellospora calospora]|uniref:5349_t:CDS:1 n=1 Tax=Scutellospora calospora TaxID=85575 RepID=A0ACA9KU41_9GLOM|nr:5349_t:CDS:2 [Scutellospora calospora]